MKRLLSFFRLPIIMPLPAGMQGVEPGGGAGLLPAFMQNANSYSQQLASYATTGNNATIVPSDVVDGIIQLNGGAGGGFTVTLPSTDSILGALGASVPQDGSFTKIVRIVNNAIGQTGTLTPGDGKTTVVGTATIATSVSRDYAMRVGPGSTIVFSNTGALTL